MNYWLVKGNPNQNDLDSMLKRTRPDRWRTKKQIPKDMSKDDRVFIYESGTSKHLVAFATVANPSAGSSGTDNFFTLQYLTQRFSDVPHQDEIRRVPGLEDPSFLKSGNAATIYRLKDREPALLYDLVSQRNPELASIWSDLQMDAEDAVTDIPLEELPSAPEGNRVLQIHFKLERNAKLVKQKKEHVKSQNYPLTCEVCDFDFLSVYGSRGFDFCEVHHRIPLSAKPPTTTTLEDLAIVCSNCHRMLHRPPWTTVEELRKAIRHARPTLEYRGYEGSVIYGPEDRLFHGRLLGIRDMVIYDGLDVDAIEKNFQDAVDSYLEFSEADGRPPNKPRFYGSLT